MDSDQNEQWLLDTQNYIIDYVKKNYSGKEVSFAGKLKDYSTSNFQVRIKDIFFYIFEGQSNDKIEDGIDKTMSVLQREDRECIICYGEESNEKGDIYCSQCFQLVCFECRTDLIFKYGDFKCPYCRKISKPAQLELLLIEKLKCKSDDESIDSESDVELIG